MKNKIVATDPPNLQNQYGVMMGWLVAAISIFFGVMHLFRIDTFVPIIDSYAPGGVVAASLLAIFVVLAEVFGVPFVLRMKLSPLAHIVSGALAVVPPLFWLLVSIWSYGLGVSTGQFGSFITTHSGFEAILLNSTWLVFVMATLWALGYGHFKLPELTKSTVRARSASK